MAPKCTKLLRLALIFPFISSSVFTIPCAVAKVKPPAQTKSQPDYSPLISELREYIPQMMTQKNFPGLAVGLIDGEKLVWAEGFGFTDQSKKVKVTEDTLFSLQSVSTTCTATGFLIAETKGWLKLDDPLKKYAPAFTVKSRFGADEVNKITFRHLLSHRAGLSHEAPVGNGFDDTICTFEDHVKSISDSWLIAPVGERHSYSNLGIDLVGYVLGIRSRKSFEQFMKDELFTPLGMTSSSFDQKEALRNPSFAKGHFADTELPDTFIPMIPSGGMYSSVKDMAKFVSFHLAGGMVKGKRLIAEDLLKEMYTPQFAPTKDEIYGYGLGVGVVAWRGKTLLNHGGGGYGYNSALYWIPEYQIGVVILANAFRLSDYLPGEIANRALLMMTQAKYGSIPPDKPVSHSDKPIANLGAEQLRRLVGTYKFGNNSSLPANIVSFKVEEGSLFYVSGNLKVKLDAYSPTEFTSGNQKYTFRLDNAGKVTGVLVQSWGNVGLFMPINEHPDDPPGPNRPEWQAFIGKYAGKISGFTIRASVSIKNGYLYVSWGAALRLSEYEPGLFFASDGESVRFQDDRMWLGNKPFVKGKTAIGGKSERP